MAQFTQNAKLTCNFLAHPMAPQLMCTRTKSMWLVATTTVNWPDLVKLTQSRPIAGEHFLLWTNLNAQWPFAHWTADTFTASVGLQSRRVALSFLAPLKCLIWKMLRPSGWCCQLRCLTKSVTSVPFLLTKQIFCSMEGGTRTQWTPLLSWSKLQKAQLKFTTSPQSQLRWIRQTSRWSAVLQWRLPMWTWSRSAATHSCSASTSRPMPSSVHPACELVDPN